MTPFDQAWLLLKMPLLPETIEREGNKATAKFQNPKTMELYDLIAEINPNARREALSRLLGLGQRRELSDMQTYSPIGVKAVSPEGKKAGHASIAGNLLDRRSSPPRVSQYPNPDIEEMLAQLERDGITHLTEDIEFARHNPYESIIEDHDSPNWMTSHINVEPEHQRMGLGTSMYDLMSELDFPVYSGRETEEESGALWENNQGRPWEPYIGPWRSSVR